MKVALVHDHLNQIGGAERVLLAFSELFPQAPIYTLLFDETRTRGLFSGKEVRESFIPRLPFARGRLFRAYLPLMPAATEQYDLSAFDVVLSDSSGFAKGVITSPHTLHICYCHTPTRYLWSDHALTIDPLERFALVHSLSQVTRSRLRLWDRMAAERPDMYIANSRTVQQRITKYYRRDSVVIYPPVEVTPMQVSNGVDDYFLCVGRARPYKRVDLAVRAFNRLGIRLKIAGTGEELKKLKKISKNNIEFLGEVSDGERNKLLSKAQALIHPQEEDAGITAIEAMAAGRPVIAFAKGGASETVINEKTGLLFNEQSWESLLSAVVRFRRRKFDSQAIRAHALTFDREVFKKKILTLVNESYEQFRERMSK